MGIMAAAAWPWRWFARRRGRALLAVVLVASVAAGIAVYLRRSRETPPLPPDVSAEGMEPAVVSAIEVLRKRVLEQPRSAEAWGNLGTAFFVNTLPEPSRPCFTQAERLDPANPRWPYFHGLTLVNAGDPAAALPFLRRAVEVSERAGRVNHVPRLALAEALLALGQLDEAEGHFSQVLERQPDDPRARLGLGRLAAAREDWETSRSHLLRCLSNPRARQKASTLLAAVCRRLGDVAGAARYRRQAEGLPGDANWDDLYQMEGAVWAVSKFSRYNLLGGLETNGRLAEAADFAQKLVQDYPDDFFPRLALGRDLHELGRHQEAEANLRQALRLSPENVKGHFELGRILLEKGEALSRVEGSEASARECFQEAAEHARRALAIQSDFGHGYAVLGIALNHLGERTPALEALRQAVHCSPDSPAFHFVLGKALAEESQDAEARHHLEQALEFGTPTERSRADALQLLDALNKKATRKARE
jgi:tetratricopeptide (TPR) repeat protein